MSKLFNLSRIQETSDGDLEFEKELIDMYLEDSREMINGISKIGASDLPQVKRLAHTLKGASANIGATGVQQNAYSLEKVAAGKDSSDLAKLIKELDDSFKETRVFLENYLTQIH